MPYFYSHNTSTVPNILNHVHSVNIHVACTLDSSHVCIIITLTPTTPYVGDLSSTVLRHHVRSFPLGFQHDLSSTTELLNWFSTFWLCWYHGTIPDSPYPRRCRW